VLLALTVFVVAFFRDPERVVPVDPSSIVSPADGRVIKVERVTDFKFLKDEALKISIFMNLFNVHVNRAPAAAKVLKVIYNPGRFFNASHDKASMENEQNAVIAEGPTGRRFVFNQIAGLVARRIVCHAAEGDSLAKGERFGMIRFGSRLDVYLPVDCKVSVRPGERVKAGSSVLGYWGA
jgi:phosphatidylserine decarboxylase